MAYTITGTWTIEFDSLASLTEMLDALLNNPSITNVIHDDGLLTITCEVNAIG